MPYLKIETNLSKSQVPEGFLKQTVDVLATAIKKPRNMCCVALMTDIDMTFGGTDDGCAQGYLMSVGNLGITENKRISEALFKHICGNLHIANDRMYIAFKDAPPTHVGYQDTTFHHIFGGV